MPSSKAAVHTDCVSPRAIRLARATSDDFFVPDDSGREFDENGVCKTEGYSWTRLAESASHANGYIFSSYPANLSVGEANAMCFSHVLHECRSERHE